MSSLLISQAVARACGEEIERIRQATGTALERVLLPADPAARLTGDELAGVEAAYFSVDVMGPHAGGFFSALHRAPGLRWLHTFNTGVDHPAFQPFLERGVTITNYPIVAAVPIAQTAIAGLLLLARGFPHWLAAQRERRWSPHDRTRAPARLDEQTLLILGLGAIGSEIARLARALGLRVIGVRRSPATPQDPVDELHGPHALPELLPRADWLAIACPLTDRTRGLIDAAALARLPAGARVINVARGEIVDEPALVDALARGHLGGAYLDVFASEPLDAASPLWSLPNVIVTPHNAAASQGLEARHHPGFLANLERWARKQPLQNVAAR
jgi:D-2-hydroxyacid dehydrogenase (NADP+)